MQNCVSGEAISYIATSVANALAAGTSVEQLALLAAVFSTIGDSLGIIAAQRAICENNIN